MYCSMCVLEELCVEFVLLNKARIFCMGVGVGARFHVKLWFYEQKTALAVWMCRILVVRIIFCGVENLSRILIGYEIFLLNFMVLNYNITTFSLCIILTFLILSKFGCFPINYWKTMVSYYYKLDYSSKQWYRLSSVINKNYCIQFGYVINITFHIKHCMN